MKTIQLIALLASVILACTNQNHKKMENEAAPANVVKAAFSQENEIAIQQLMETLFTATDNRDWKKVQSTMADSVYTDYTALGGESGFKTPESIVEEWAQFLPGFDRTLHQPHNFAIWVAGDRATATLDAIATHYLSTDEGEDHWTVFVGYDTEFVKAKGEW